MSTIHYRPIQASDADAVFAVAQEAWRFTHASIFDPAFIEQFVSRNYAPEQLRALVLRVDSGALFFDVAVDVDQVVGFCHIGVAAQGAQLFRIYLLPAYIGRGIGSGLLQRGEAFLQSRGLDSYFLRQGCIHRAERDQDDERYMEKRLG